MTSSEEPRSRARGMRAREFLFSLSFSQLLFFFSVSFMSFTSFSLVLCALQTGEVREMLKGQATRSMSTGREGPISGRRDERTT